jgi:hypothetical protein
MASCPAGGSWSNLALGQPTIRALSIRHRLGVLSAVVGIAESRPELELVGSERERLVDERQLVSIPNQCSFENRAILDD